MTTPRPGFARMSTEQRDPNDIEIQQRRSNTDSKAPVEHDVNDRDIKDGTFVDIKGSNHSDDTPPDYEDAGDGFAKVNGPVSSAKSLTTQVLHVEDDPTLSPYTFRVAFLGEYDAHGSQPSSVATASFFSSRAYVH